MDVFGYAEAEPLTDTYETAEKLDDGESYLFEIRSSGIPGVEDHGVGTVEVDPGRVLSDERILSWGDVELDMDDLDPYYQELLLEDAERALADRYSRFDDFERRPADFGLVEAAGLLEGE